MGAQPLLPQGTARFVACVWLAFSTIILAYVFLPNISEQLTSLAPSSFSHSTADDNGDITSPDVANPGEPQPTIVLPQEHLGIAKDVLSKFPLPEMDDFEVRGVWASEFQKRPPLYRLDPFPRSPMPAEHEEEDKHNPWLGAVICSAFHPEIRTMIRQSWMTLYADVPMDKRFVIANPGPKWSETIQRENRTHGDIIVLESIQEDDFTANTVKTMEFFRWLSEESPRKYELVTKIDTDLWLDARSMWKRHIRPLLHDDMTRAVNRTFGGQLFFEPRFGLAFPAGALYTATWDLVELLPKLHAQNHLIRNEDMLNGWLLISAGIKVNFRPMSQEEKFNLMMEDAVQPGIPWARKDSDPTARGHGLIGEEVIAVHRLKSGKLWNMVADCFDEEGLKDRPAEIESLTPRRKRPVYLRPYHEWIPENFWEVDDEGEITCNGIYRLWPGSDRELQRVD